MNRQQEYRPFPGGLYVQIEEEFQHLKSQFVTSRRGGRRALSLVFPEHGALIPDNRISGYIDICVSYENGQFQKAIKSLILSGAYSIFGVLGTFV